jgi:predicted dehydrogenase
LFKNLGAVIRGRADMAVTWDEAAAVIEMIELAYRSSREGVTVSVPTYK